MIGFAASNGLAGQVARFAREVNPFLIRSGQFHERAAVHRMALDVATEDADLVVALPALARALARLGHIAQALAANP